MKREGTFKARKQLGEAIREYRKARGWSQEKLAEKADVHHNFIGYVERAERNLTISSLLNIATALKISLAELFKTAGI